MHIYGYLPHIISGSFYYILNELFDESWEGAYDLTCNEISPSGCLCTLTTENLGSIKLKLLM